MMRNSTEYSVIRHFTNVKALYGILEKGFKFSSGSSWPDLDDKYDIERYKKISHREIGILCFCDGKGTIYHWTNLGTANDQGKDKESMMKCSISIYKEPFLEYVESLQKFEKPRKIEYCNEIDVLFREIHDIPYLKKEQYIIENELRILFIGNKVETEAIIPNIHPFIKCITISENDCNREEFFQIRTKIENKYSHLKGLVCQNTTNWQKNVEQLINITYESK